MRGAARRGWREAGPAAIAGVAGSLAVHAAVLGWLAVSPPAARSGGSPQIGRSTLLLAAEVRRQDAEPAQPSAEAVAAARGRAESQGASGVRADRATAAPVAPQRVAAGSVASPRLAAGAAAETSGTVVAGAAIPAEPASVARPPGTATEAARPSPMAVPGRRPGSERQTAAASAAPPVVAVPPDQDPRPAAVAGTEAVVGAAPAVSVSAAVGPSPLSLVAAAEPAVAARPLAPSAEAERTTAAFASETDAMAVLGPAEFALLAAELRLQAATASSSFKGEVRDAIGAALATFPCSRLQARFNPDSGALEARGHVATPRLAGQLRPLLGSVTGEAFPISVSVQVLPAPQCAALAFFAALGLEQSADQSDDPMVVGETAQAAILGFADGEVIALTAEAPDFAAHLYVDLYAADGSVLHVVPWRDFGRERLAAGTRIRIGDGSGGGPVLTAAPPYGVDLVLMLAVSDPLAGGARPSSEPAEGYHRWLAGELERLHRERPGFRSEWVYVLVETRAPGHR